MEQPEGRRSVEIVKHVPKQGGGTTEIVEHLTPVASVDAIAEGANKATKVTTRTSFDGTLWDGRVPHDGEGVS